MRGRQLRIVSEDAHRSLVSQLGQSDLSRGHGLWVEGGRVLTRILAVVVIVVLEYSLSPRKILCSELFSRDFSFGMVMPLFSEWFEKCDDQVNYLPDKTLSAAVSQPSGRQETVKELKRGFIVE